MKHYTCSPGGPAVPRTVRSLKLMRVFALTAERLQRDPLVLAVPVMAEGITYVTGYSGSGKSTLLRLFLEDHPEAVVPCAPQRDDVPLIDLVGDELEEALSILGWIGLGEAYLLLRPYRALSEGQKSRAQLACALAKRPRLIIVDEFLSTLDRMTAKVVALCFQRVCRRFSIAAVVATSHPDLVAPLAPDRVIELDLNAVHRVCQKPVASPVIPELASLVVEEGTEEDYRQLSRFHYFPEFDLETGRETQIYVLRHDGQCIGVSVLGTPYPVSWSDIPWFREVNERLRVCFRLVVHPVYRGIGLSKMLIRPPSCRSPYIEVRSALGLYQPIYLSAGFHKVELPTNTHTNRRKRFEEYARRVGASDVNSLHSADRCLALVNQLSSQQRRRLHRLAVSLYAEHLVQDLAYYRRVAELPALTRQELSNVESFFTVASSDVPLEALLEDTAYFAMQGFAVRHIVSHCEDISVKEVTRA